jgi:hypothetical protein
MIHASLICLLSTMTLCPAYLPEKPSLAVYAFTFDHLTSSQTEGGKKKKRTNKEQDRNKRDERVPQLLRSI